MSPPSTTAAVATPGVAATAPAAIPEAAPEYRRPEHVPEYRSPEPAPEYRSPEPEPWARDEQPRAMPPPPPPAPPPPNLDAVLRESGLVMIETVRGQAPAPEPEEEPQGRRPRRERRAPPAGLDEPLEQVETRGDDGKPEPRLP